MTSIDFADIEAISEANTKAILTLKEILASKVQAIDDDIAKCKAKVEAIKMRRMMMKMKEFKH